jgi:hypothetical protein
MIEDICEGRKPFGSICGIKGLTMKKLSTFISDENARMKRRGHDPSLPGVGELRKIAGDTSPGEEPPEQQEGSSFEYQGNIGVATLTTCFPENARTEKLLDDLKINKDDWLIERIQPNTWQTMTSKRGEPEVVTLYQMKIWMRRKVPVHSEWPLIQPIVVNPDFLGNSKGRHKHIRPSRPSNMRCALVITDTQNGYLRDMRTGSLREFHDRRAWEIACMIAAREQPETIVLIGDHCDLPDWSDKFARTPEMYFTTQPMLLELHWWLARLRYICPSAEIIFIEGNHEERLQRAVTNNMINAWGLQSVDDFKAGAVPTLSVENLLSLPSLGINYLGPYPDGEFWINNNIKAEHGNIAKSNPQETARAILGRSRSSTVFGHVHRREAASKNEYRKGGFVTYTAECFGCMCHLDGRVPSHEQKHQWNQGLGLVWYEPGNGLFRTEHIPIHEGQAIYGQEVLVGKPDIAAIERGCNWKFS